jgi:hypothetical protein
MKVAPIVTYQETVSCTSKTVFARKLRLDEKIIKGGIGIAFVFFHGNFIFFNKRIDLVLTE